MGLLTWVIVAIVVLAAIGLGVGAFFSGVLLGAEKVSEVPIVEKATNEIREFVANVTNEIR